MAFAVGGAGSRVKMFLQFIDNFGQRPVWRQFDVDWNTDLATTISDAVEIADLVAAVTGMKCELGHVQVELNDSSAASPEATATRFQDGIITLALDTSGQGKSPFGNVRIPFPHTNVRVSTSGQGYHQIDLADAAVSALTDEYEAAGRLTVNDGQDSTAVKSGKIVSVRGKVLT